MRTIGNIGGPQRTALHQGRGEFLMLAEQPVERIDEGHHPLSQRDRFVNLGLPSTR